MSEERTTKEQRGPGSASALSVGVVAHVLGGRARGTTRLVGNRMTIGKSEENHLVLADKTVSRRHCELLRTADGIKVCDLGSTNGTFVDGTRVLEALVLPGARIRIGAVDIELRASAKPIEVLPSEKTKFGPAVGRSLAMRSVFAVLEYMAPSNASILLEGETGTGKEVLARAIQKESRRRKGPFVVVDCGAVTPSLVESELFGHEKGAFTGAIGSRQGAFEQADGGTLFLDEIGELPLDLQPKLLRALEAKSVKRVGSNAARNVDVRIIAATKRDLVSRVAEGAFREDLYFRLAVVPVRVPALRTRRDDIPMLVQLILDHLGAADLVVTDEVMNMLLVRDWPGNVRELRNTVERAAHMARGSASTEIDLHHFATTRGPERAFHFDDRASLVEATAAFQAAYARWLVERHGSVEAAGAVAGVEVAALEALAAGWDDQG